MRINRSVRNIAAAVLMTIGGISTAHAQTAEETKPAPAYYIASFEVTNDEALAPYSQGVPATVEQYGGRFLVRRGELAPKEGEAPKSRVIVIQFDSMEKALAWYDSPEYSALRPIRQQNGETDAYFVEGFSE